MDIEKGDIKEPKELRRNRINRQGDNRQRISYAIEKAKNSARKSRTAGFTPLDFTQHIPRVGRDGKLIKLVQWRDSPVDMQACMYQLALAEIEATTDKVLIPFAYRISETLINQAYRSDTGSAAYIYKRLKDSLRRTLNRKAGDMPEFWFSFELAGKGHYHIQGAIALHPQEVIKKSLAREAFYKIAGNLTHKEKSASLRFRHGKRKRLINHWGQLTTDTNWALYNTKERFQIQTAQVKEKHNWQPRRPSDAPIKIKLGESIVSASNGLTAHAKRLHADLLIKFKTGATLRSQNPKWASW